MAIGITELLGPSAPLVCWRRRSYTNLSRRRSVRVIGVVKPSQTESIGFTEPESKLLEALLGVQGRGRGVSPKQLQDVELAVQSLEASKGIPDPTSSDLIEGSWQLIFTTRPGTASPIQRTFVGVDKFKIFQEVYLRTEDPRVTNIVKFSDSIGELRVEAVATVKDGVRILFRFDRAAFSFKFLPFKVPYPVPFRLLGDEAKGWLDTTYLSSTGNIRISKGNKGTTFVLQKLIDPRQKLLSAISSNEGILEAIKKLISSNNSEIRKDLEFLAGEWQFLWTSASQLYSERWSSIASFGLQGTQVIKKNGELVNSSSPFIGSKIIGIGTLAKRLNGDTFSVTINDGNLQFGPLKLPLEVEGNLEMEILYIDNKIRVARVAKIILVHLRL